MYLYNQAKLDDSEKIISGEWDGSPINKQARDYARNYMLSWANHLIDFARINDTKITKIVADEASRLIHLVLESAEADYLYKTVIYAEARMIVGMVGVASDRGVRIRTVAGATFNQEELRLLPEERNGQSNSEITKSGSDFYVPEHPLVPETFTIEGGFYAEGYHEPDKRWNGWARPWFTWETAEALTIFLSGKNGERHVIDAVNKRILCYDNPNDPHDFFVVDGQVVETVEGTKTLYPYGAGYYIWSVKGE